jgi:cytochrome c oxidase subunit 1
MTTVTLEPPLADPAPEAVEPENYLTCDYSLKSWLLTTDHKRICILYTILITGFFFLGSTMAMGIRLVLLWPNGHWVTNETYNRMFTLHGVIMVWWFLIPSIPATLGNFLMPLMIGARDLAFPKLNLLSWYLLLVGGILTITVMLLGGVDTGWTFYTPLSSQYLNSYVVLTVVGIFIAGFSTILTGLNFIVTVHTMRCPGMTWFRLPLFVWAMYAASIVMVLATPVIAMTLLLIAVERIWHVGIFDPALGGDPVLFQHFFWFYSHPAVYIMVLPSMAVIPEIITCFARKQIFGYAAIAFSSLGIAFLGFLVWAHHMFVAGISLYAGLVFSWLSMLVAVPSAIKVFNWTATLYKGSIQMTASMLFALAFIGLFVMGGLTGVLLATLGIDVHVHDTFFVVAHFHYIMVGGAITAYLGGIHYWWPKITGRLYSELCAKLSAPLIFVGYNLTFFPQFILGYLGMPRRYPIYPPEFQVYNVLSTAGATILGLGYLMPFCYLLWSLKYGKRASANPWDATGLEWQTPSPPPKHNFDKIPVVTDEPYAYYKRKTPIGPI